MRLFDEISNAKGGEPVKKVAKKYGVEEHQVNDVLKEYIPAITGGIKKNISKKDGLESLINALNKGRHDRYLDEPDELTHSRTVNDGNDILGHILGSKDVSRELAKRTSQRTGMSNDILKQLLPVIASMTMGALKKQAGNSGVLGGSSMGRRNPQDALGPLASILDADGDNSIIDDVIGMAGKILSNR